MNDNDRIIIEKLAEINPTIGAVVKALLITDLDEETILEIIYQLDDMAQFKRWGEVTIFIQEGNVSNIVGQKSIKINRPLRKKRYEKN